MSETKTARQKAPAWPGEWYIVGRGFAAGGELLVAGTPFDASSLGNTENLVAAGYLRAPACEAEEAAIRAAMERERARHAALAPKAPEAAKPEEPATEPPAVEPEE